MKDKTKIVISQYLGNFSILFQNHRRISVFVNILITFVRNEERDLIFNVYSRYCELQNITLDVTCVMKPSRLDLKLNNRLCF